MLMDKYKIVIFHGTKGSCRQISCSKWFLMFLIVFITGLLGSNFYLYRHWSKARHCQRQLAAVTKENREQKIQLASFSSKFKKMAEDINRLQEFNTRIRVMVDLDHPSFENSMTGLGGPRSKDLDNEFFPLYQTERLARRMHSFIDQLSTNAKLEELRQQEIISIIQKKEDILARTPSIWPTKGWLTSKFGYRKSPFTGQREFHKGLDISAPKGTPIYASAEGKVVMVHRTHGYGKNILIDHANGIVTRYAHLSKYAVKKGDRVKRGQLIAYVGNTGRSTGPHLHYEVRVNGVPVNPLRYILD
ncbi:peptidase M24 [Desulfoplanes formicivorans]|uniref:Peptidase M24 n=2 Tax=Desulfoplanes formicivorans TaxID=1592317 RepID=A0A194AI88_9BACT|nr:peptidase M24 [Desulfoplanes formicivorans]